MADNNKNSTPLQADVGLTKHDSSVLDLAFAMDCTGSMSSYIKTAQNNIRNIVEQLVGSEKSDIQLALVEYRDHPPQDTTFVTRTHDFTPSVSKMKEWLNNCSAQGGGDLPEAVADALHDVYKLSWRENSTKICVLISDAPPHGLINSGDHFPNGSPSGIDPMVVVRQMAEKGITLYSVGCEPSILPYKEFFSAIAYLTGGQYVPLTAAKLLTQVIIGGAQEEMSLEKCMAEVDEEVQNELAAGREINEDEMSKRVHTKLKAKGIKTKQLRRNAAELDEASATSKMYSSHNNMAALKKKFKLGPGSYFPSRSSVKVSKAGKKMKAKMNAKMKAKMKANVKARVKKKGKLSGRKRSGPPLVDECAEETLDIASPMEDSYETVETEATEQQVKRMVQKSKMRNIKKF